MIHAAAGYTPESLLFGRMIGQFEYEGKVFEFHFNIHKPKQGSPRLSNKMTTIQEIVYNQDKKHGPDFDWLSYEDTPGLFAMAFWDHTPDSCITKPEDIALRSLMHKITHYSRENGLCRKIRKNDKKHETWYKKRHETN